MIFYYYFLFIFIDLFASKHVGQQQLSSLLLTCERLTMAQIKQEM